MTGVQTCALPIYLVVGRVDARQGDTGVELDPEADGIEHASRGMLDWRSETRRVRYLVRSGNVARADDHGKAQPKLPPVVSDGLLVLDLDGDRGAGRNVGDRGREDVGPLFLDEARALASCFACSYCALADARSWMTPSIERSPICIRR